MALPEELPDQVTLRVHRGILIRVIVLPLFGVGVLLQVVGDVRGGWAWFAWSGAAACAAASVPIVYWFWRPPIALRVDHEGLVPGWRQRRVGRVEWGDVAKIELVRGLPTFYLAIWLHDDAKWLRYHRGARAPRNAWSAPDIELAAYHAADKDVLGRLFKHYGSVDLIA